jgi:transposase
LDGQLDELQQTVRRRPDATLKELQAMLGTTASVAAVHRALRKLKMTFKKKSSCPPNSNDRRYKNNVVSGASDNQVCPSSAWCLSMKRRCERI